MLQPHVLSSSRFVLRSMTEPTRFCFCNLYLAQGASPHPKPRCTVGQCTRLHSAYDCLRFTAYEPVGQSYRADTIQPLRHVVGKASPLTPPMVSPLTCSSAPNPLRCRRYPLHCAAALSSPHIAITRQVGRAVSAYETKSLRAGFGPHADAFTAQWRQWLCIFRFDFEGGGAVAP